VAKRLELALKKKSEPEIISIHSWKRLPWLVHGFSTRRGGFSTIYGESALNLGFTKDDSPTAVRRNRVAFLDALGKGSGLASWPLVTLRQTHSDLIHLVDQPPAFPLVGDGLVTEVPRILLAVQTADCLPVILVDRKTHAIGIFHAGWRGTVKRIVEKGVGELRRWFGTQPRNLLAAIGPAIHACCYEVGEEVRDKFHSQFAYARQLFRESQESDEIRQKYPLLFMTARAPGHSDLPQKIFLDLVEANRQQLLTAGLPTDSITASQLCTRCNRGLLFSYRAERGRTGRMMAVAGIKN